MKVKRRLTFQLTPLLDLLLIVIFAQYMEVRQKADAVQTDLIAREARLEETIRARQAELENDLIAQKAELSALRERYSDHYENILQQHAQAGRTLAQALNLPGTLLEQVLRLKTDGNLSDARNLEAAMQQMKEVLESRGSEMLRFILKYNEMQKHVSVWELHLQDNGQALFSDGQVQQNVSYGTTEEFISRSFEASKGFTDPKPLVIILMTHGDTQAGLRKRATDGMTGLMERLRTDSANTRWFDFSLMGFRPDGPLIGIRNN